MTFDDEQRGVLRGALPALAVSLIVISFGIFCDVEWLTASGTAERLRLLALSLIPPSLCLMHAIGRMGNQRFVEPLDRNAAVAETHTVRADRLQAILRNTVEQTVLASLMYTITAMLLPHQWLETVLYCSLLFLTGRIAFTIGYQRGAAGRAFGFGLTFYPTILLAISLLPAIFA